MAELGRAAAAVDDIEAAFEHARQRFVERGIAPLLDRSETNHRSMLRTCRELREIIEAFRRVHDDAAANGNGWDWNLLHMLDWDGGTVEVNERRYRPRLLVENHATTGGQALAKQEQQADELAARGKRLRALRDAHAAAQPDLDWAMRRSGESGFVFAAANVGMTDLIDRALEDHESTVIGIRAIGQIHGRVRRVEHVKVAAMLVLGKLHGINGAAALAKLIRDGNANECAPCPTFAEHAGDETIRKMFSRCGLAGGF